MTITAKIIKYINLTNELWDTVKEPWKFFIALGSVSLIVLFFPDIFFVLFAMLLVIWRIAGRMLRESE